MDSVGPKHHLASLYSFPKILHEGQRLQVTVLPPGVDGHPRVGVAGVVVRADVPQGYPEGSRLTALVRGVDDSGRISLEIVSEPPRVDTAPEVSYAPRDEVFAAALMRSGLAVTERNVQTLRSGSAGNTPRTFVARLLALVLDKGVSHDHASQLRASMPRVAPRERDDPGERGAGFESEEQLVSLLHGEVARYADRTDPLHLFNHLPGRNGDCWVRIPLGEVEIGCRMSAELRLRFPQPGGEASEAVLEVATPKGRWTVHWPATGQGLVRIYTDRHEAVQTDSAEFRSLAAALAEWGLTVRPDIGSDAGSDGFSDDPSPSILPHIDTTA